MISNLSKISSKANVGKKYTIDLFARLFNFLESLINQARSYFIKITYYKVFFFVIK